MRIANEHGSKSLDAIHLAAALVPPQDELCFVTWDAKLHRAARTEGLMVIPGSVT